MSDTGVRAMAVHLGDGWHVVNDWRGPDRVYETHCGRRFYCHGPSSSHPDKLAPVDPDLWPQTAGAGYECGCGWLAHPERIADRDHEAVEEVQASKSLRIDLHIYTSWPGRSSVRGAGSFGYSGRR